jgi:hypothetical protein
VSRDATDRRFWFGLRVIAGLGLLLRLQYLFLSRDTVFGGDGTYYHQISGLIADGKGFISPASYFLQGVKTPSAVHPPLWPLLLAVFARLGMRTLFEQQIVASLVGTATIVVVGCAARKVAGVRAGWFAAGLAAIMPTFFIYERELLSETLALLLVAIALLLALRFREQPSLGRALAVGLTCGLLALTRSEQVLLLALLLVPLLLLTPGIARRNRWLWLGAAVVVGIATIAPWSIYNSSRFKNPVLLSTELGPTMVEANCPSVYFGSRIGYADGLCRRRSPANHPAPNGDDTTRDSGMRREAITFIRNHAARFPLVVLAREGRTWGLFSPNQQMHFESTRGTRLIVDEAGLVVYWAVAAAAAVGVVVLRRRRVALLPLMAFPATVVIGVAISFGSVRYRAPAEVVIAVLAAVALDAALSRMSRPRSGSRAADAIGARHEPGPNQ